MPEDIGAAAGEIEWRTSAVPVPYDEAVAVMEERVAAIRAGSGVNLAITGAGPITNDVTKAEFGPSGKHVGSQSCGSG